jgi:methylase of polypeptide subunit release factors
LANLADTGYRFVTPTPLTHQRVLANRAGTCGVTLRDIFGWNLPFDEAALSPELRDLMHSAGVLSSQGGLFASTVRVSSIGNDLFMHSAFPTLQDDAVFFGPDTYRFANFLRPDIQRWSTASTGAQPLRVVDIGCGSGAGGIVAVRALAATGRRSGLVLNDINPLALRYAAANSAFNGVDAELAEGDALTAVTGSFDLIISNPPYMVDPAQRAYRHGGGDLGRALSARIAAQALPRLSPGGQLLLYTGIAISDGHDAFLSEMESLLAGTRWEWSYSEIDPDVFGEELSQQAYRDVDRIAAVGLTVRRPNETC